MRTIRIRQTLEALAIIRDIIENCFETSYERKAGQYVAAAIDCLQAELQARDNMGKAGDSNFLT